VIRHSHFFKRHQCEKRCSGCMQTLQVFQNGTKQLMQQPLYCAKQRLSSELEFTCTLAILSPRNSKPVSAELAVRSICVSLIAAMSSATKFLQFVIANFIKNGDSTPTRPSSALQLVNSSTCDVVHTIHVASMKASSDLKYVS
jgi:hypothetical protein